MIRLTIPSIEEDDLAAVREVLETGYLVQGPRVAAFEKALAERLRLPHAVAVSSGTAALHLSLLALDVRPGDLVLVTAYSYPATANVVELCGAQPVFVDIRPDTFNMDPQQLENALLQLKAASDTARRVKAVLPVHAFGLMADMPALLAVAERHGVPVVEDAACALGASLGGRPAGAWGCLGCFSFHPRKAVTTGEGGLVTTSRADLAGRVRSLRNHGLDPEGSAPDFVRPGLNCRLTDFSAALGTTQLAKLDRIIAARRRWAGRYDRLLEGTPVQPPRAPADCFATYQSYVVLLPPNAAPRRAAIIRQLKEQGIEAQIGTYHLPLCTYYRSRYGYRPGDFPVTDEVFARSLSLPLHERLTESDLEEVVRKLMGMVR